MGLYIRIQDGKPYEHPITEENLKQAFPSVDLNNLPPEFSRFERIERPILNVYEILEPEESTYELIDGVCKEVWHKRNLTAEEKYAKQQAVKDYWTSLPDSDNWSAWIFDEEKCEFQPPTPKPQDGKPYFWQGTTSSWVVLPKRPNDGKKYRLNYASAKWVELVQL